MRLSYIVELQPTQKQHHLFVQNVGAARWAYNWGLRLKIDAYESRKAMLSLGVSLSDAIKVPKAIELHKKLNSLKKIPKEEGGVPWMYEVSKCSAQEALRNLDLSFENFFRGIKEGKKTGYPKFKSKKNETKGFRLTVGIKVTDKRIYLPRIGWVRIKPGNHGYIPSNVYVQVSVVEKAGRWYASVREKTEKRVEVKNGDMVGVDLGVARLATLSDGSVYNNVKAFKRKERKIRKLHRDVSRKKNGSSNMKKALKNLSRAYRKVSNMRSDSIHHATTAIAKQYGCVVLEDLKVRNMTKKVVGKGKKAKSELNKLILDAGLYEFRRQLEYKGDIYGCKVVVVPSAYTSQICSNCGCVDKNSRISQSQYVCVHCGFDINADLNAAINIKRRGESFIEGTSSCV